MIHNQTFRTALKYISLILVIATVLVSSALFSDKQYASVSFALAVMTCVIFVTGYEQKKTGTRRLVISSVMTALAMTGRLFPILKPTTAIIILSAVYLGSESGFLIGSMTAVLSNFYIGQGPWTPFQMMALGVIGFVSGIFGERLSQKRSLLIFYGIICGIAYSFIMDIWTMLWHGQGFDIKIYLTALATAVPVTIQYAVANAVFLYLMAKPFGDKLGRIKVKYGV